MTVPAAVVPALSGQHPFRGLSVAETAGLELRPGSIDAVFDQDVWDLTGLADAPTVMSRHRKILDFTAIANPRWRQVAREYLLARLAPRHPAVACLPHAFRAPLNPHSLWGELRHLTGWFNHLTSAGVATLGGVDQQHGDTYLAGISASTTDPDRRRVTNANSSHRPTSGHPPPALDVSSSRIDTAAPSLDRGPRPAPQHLGKRSQEQPLSAIMKFPQCEGLAIT